MKKLYFLYAAGLVALASCSSNTQKSAEATDATATEETTEAVYKGVLPAADCEGIEYTVNLVYAPESTTDGTFDMTQVYMSDTDPATFNTKGNFTVKTGTPQSADQKYLVLASESAPSDTTYFVVKNDSTITFVTYELTPSTVVGLNYDLTKK
ncbi:MAG: copper resistance protein NlpE [Bacteroidales bacterium]|nr:copper resistance protein NlpE [Bacteroidales bacterium]